MVVAPLKLEVKHRYRVRHDLCHHLHSCVCRSGEGDPLRPTHTNHSFYAVGRAISEQGEEAGRVKGGIAVRSVRPPHDSCILELYRKLSAAPPLLCAHIRERSARRADTCCRRGMNARPRFTRVPRLYACYRCSCVRQAS